MMTLNVEDHNCAVCSKIFKRAKKKGLRMRNGLRQFNSQTCSPKCAKILFNNPGTSKVSKTFYRNAPYLYVNGKKINPGETFGREISIKDFEDPVKRKKWEDEDDFIELPMDISDEEYKNIFEEQ